jgi:hypothetical protein
MNLQWCTSPEDSSEMHLLCPTCIDDGGFEPDDSQPLVDSHARCDFCEITQAELE